MDVRKGYKQTEVGIIPDDWDVKSLAGEVDLLTGFPFTSNSYSSNGVRLLRGSNIKRGNTDWDEQITRFFPKETSELRKYRLNVGDITIAMDGSLVGRSYACITEKDLPCLLVQRVARIRSQNIDLGYLSKFIGNDYFVKYCDSVKTVTAIPHISPKDIRSFAVPLPPTKAEQTAIAQALSDTDSLIAALEKLIAKKSALKQGTIQVLLTGKKRLSGFNGEWKINAIGKLFKFLSSANNSRSDLADDGEIGYIHYGDIHTKWSGFLDLSAQAIPYIQKDKVKNVPFLEEGDLIVSDASEDYDGLGASIEIRNVGRKRVVAGLHTFLLRGDKNLVADGFKGYMPYLPGFHDALIRIATGISVYGISRKNFASIEIKLPDVEEQQAIAQVLTDMDSEIAGLEEKLEKYKAIKSGMMQELLTGKIRLVKS